MTTSKILVVDDEPFNLDIIRAYLEHEDLDVVECEDGQAAWIRLSAGESFDAVILDRMMPKMDGMEVLEKMKGDPKLRDIPVIMQTSASASNQIAEGIRSGAYYYLTKPYDRSVFLAIVRSALELAQQGSTLKKEIAAHQGIVHLARSASFYYSTLDEAKALSIALSGAAEDPVAAGLGLIELLVNAVEHGNLGITFEEKVKLLTEGDYLHELERRMKLPGSAAKQVAVEFARKGRELYFEITDAGAGFDWTRFLELDSERALAPCGRGIAMARILAFKSMEFRGKGNQVLVSINAA